MALFDLKGLSAQPLPPGVEQRVIDRSDFGQADSPTWSALTAFEEEVLAWGRTPASTRGDSSNQLLGLYLLASADVRRTEAVQHYRQVLQAFWKEHAGILQENNEGLRGALLLRAMHDEFLDVYEENQSALSVIFRTGHYNCISSALLYVVLATHAGLDASGVVMPSHAFVQLHLSDGREIEVETTSADGFDVIRNPDFFVDEGVEWFEERRLAVPSWEDYRQRRVISARELGLENFWSQHLKAQYLDYSDRLRMAELHSLLQPERLEAHHNRLVYYYRETEYFLHQDDTDSLRRLYRHAENFLEAMETLLNTGSINSDSMSFTPLLLVQANRSEQLVNRGRQQQGVGLAKDILRRTGTDGIADAGAIRHYAWRALGAALTQAGRRMNHEQGLLMIASLEAQCLQAPACGNALDQFYIDWAAPAWDRHDWPEVIAIYGAYLQYPALSPNHAVFLENLETAYLNQAATDWFDEDRDSAYQWLQKCVASLPSGQRCRERLAEVKGQRF